MVFGRLGSPSVRTPWTSCPVTWLFGVETGGRLRRPGEELWGLHWGGPVAESSRQSVLSTRAGSRESGSQSCGRVRTVGTFFPSEEAFADRGQEPACRLPSSAFCFASGSGIGDAQAGGAALSSRHQSPSVLVPPTPASWGHRRKSPELHGCQQSSSHLRGPEKI